MKEENVLKAIVQHFNIENKIVSIKPLLDGHINDTFCIGTQSGKKYILQKKNKKIFQDVPAMMDNILKITEHIKKKAVLQGNNPNRETITIIFTKDKKCIYGYEYV